MAAGGSWRRAFVGSTAEAVATARWIDRIAGEQAFPAETLFAVQVCAEELLTNIVRHGGNPGPRIEVTLSLSADRVELMVEDDGKPFDVATTPPHRIDQPLEEVQPGGLGIQLIHSFADRLSYQRAGLGNRVLAAFDRPDATAIGSEPS